MKRIALTAVLLAVSAGVAFVIWSNAAGGAVAQLSEDERAAARESGEGARELGDIAESEGVGEIPTLAEMKDVTVRERVEGWAESARAALAVAAPDERPDLLVITAELERVLGNVDRAVELAREGAQALPANSQARYVYGSALLSQIAANAGGGGIGALFSNLAPAKEAKAEFATAIDLDPSNHEARVKLVLILAYAPRFILGDDGRAAELVEGIVPHRPEFDRDYWRAELLIADEEYDEALSAYRQLAELRPDDPDVLARIGDLLMLRERWRDAAAAFDRITWAGTHPQQMRAPYEAAKARVRGAFDLERAVELLNGVLERDAVGETQPSVGRVKYHLGMVLMKLRRFAEARAAFEEAKRLTPEVARVERALMELDEREAAGE